MAFGHCEALCVLNFVTKWHDPHESQKHRAWTLNLEGPMRPFSARGVLVNFLGEERVRAAYAPAKYDSLVVLKNKYDSTNNYRYGIILKKEKGVL